MTFYFILTFFKSIVGLWNKCPSESYKLYNKPKICAVLYEDEDCRTGSWRSGLEIPDTNWQPFPLPFDLRYDTESLIVKRGCVLRAYSDPM